MALDDETRDTIESALARASAAVVTIGELYREAIGGLNEASAAVAELEAGE